MATYGVAEAKNNFTHLLDRVQEGEKITITRHGKPIAELSATSPLQASGPTMTMEQRRARMMELLANPLDIPPLGISAADLVRQMRDEGY
jgi:antitoxin (DNA-binding transcriptional repressor) of toxin-antitoxin stability system